MRSAVLAVLLLASTVAPAAADDDPRFRRTTPRAAFARYGEISELGVPSGRAWGVESALRPVRSGDAAVAIDLRLDDGAVREAFVRIAWYDRAEGRPRQMATSDSRLVRIGERGIATVALDPPPGAVAYRVRVLARVVAGEPASEADAIRFGRVRVRGERSGAAITRLELTR